MGENTLVDFGNPDELKRWLGEQPSDLGIALAARAALRVLPMIPFPLGGLLPADAVLAVANQFRNLSIVWILSGPYRHHGNVHDRARSAAVRPLRGTLFATSAAQAARRSAAEVVRALATPNKSPQKYLDSLATAITLALAAEAEFPECSGLSALLYDVNSLAGRRATFLSSLPLWRQMPRWAMQRWRDLRDALNKAGQDWQVWTVWYDNRLAGRIEPSEYELAYVDVPDIVQKRGPASVNKELLRRLEVLDHLPTTGQVSGNEPEPKAETFGEFLSWLLNRGTRQSGHPDTTGVRWTNMSFAAAVGESGRIIQDWRAGQFLPADLTSIERELFGNNPAYRDFRNELRRLYSLSWTADPNAEDVARASLKPPEAPLPPPSPATQFSYTDGRFDIAPSNAWRDREARAGAYHTRARTLAAVLVDRLSRTDAVPDVAGSVSALLDVLGEGVAEVQPDLLRLASRSLAARARVYGHPAAQWEISAESVSAFFELADVLVDLQAFVRTDLEAHEQAVRELDLTPETAAEAKMSLDLVTEVVLSATELVTERAQNAFEAAAEVSVSATDSAVKVAVEGDRALLTANLALAVAREMGREVKEVPLTETGTQTGGQDLGKPPIGEPEPKLDKPATRKRSPGMRTKARTDEDRLQDFGERFMARIYDKGPNRLADATLDAMAGMIRHGPKTVVALGAGLVLWAAISPVAATGGAIGTTIAWILYELRRKGIKSE
jgi:hypothetical protein